MSRFIDRVVGAAHLDVRTYEDVEADTSATPQAMAVVVLVAVASGVGAMGTSLSGVGAAVVGALVGWVVWAGLIWIIGTMLLPERQTEADAGQLLRTIGFAASPGLLLVLRLLPLVGLVVAIVVWIWQLMTTVVAVRQALDYKSTGRAIVVCLIGWVIYIMVSLGIAALVGIRHIELG
jgi:Yip1 domain